MLKIYKSHESGHLEELSIQTLEKGAWISLINPTPYELKVISNITEVEIDLLKSALDEEERSHTESEDNCVMILTNVPIMRANDIYDTLPLGIVITRDYIITVSLESTEVVNAFNDKTAMTFRTFKKTRFVFQILYKSATFYLKYIKQINKRSEEIEQILRRSLKNQALFQLLELQKGLTYFNASLRSNGSVLEKLLRIRSNLNYTAILKMYEEDEDLLEDVIIENKQAREMVEMYSKILSRMSDTFASIISNNLNLVMKFLTSITIILAIPTFISSFFGMNVPVPFGHSPYGFVYISVIALLTSLICTVILWKKDMF